METINGGMSLRRSKPIKGCSVNRGRKRRFKRYNLSVKQIPWFFLCGFCLNIVHRPTGYICRGVGVFLLVPFITFFMQICISFKIFFCVLQFSFTNSGAFKTDLIPRYKNFYVNEFKVFVNIKCSLSLSPSSSSSSRSICNDFG